jgi:hypothetical protein
MGIRMMLLRLALAAGLALVADVHVARADFWPAMGNAIEKGAHDTGHAITKVAHKAGNAIERGAHDTGHAIKKAAHKAGNAIERGAHDIGHAITKTTHDTRKPPPTQGPKYNALTTI